jgi:hypothetical protein
MALFEELQYRAAKKHINVVWDNQRKVYIAHAYQEGNERINNFSNLADLEHFIAVNNSPLQKRFVNSGMWDVLKSKTDPAIYEAKKRLMDAKGDPGGKIFVLLIHHPQSGYESSVFHSKLRSQVEQQAVGYKREGWDTKIVRVNHYGD